MTTRSFVSPAPATRLDRALALGLGLSLRQVRSLLETQCALVDGLPLRKGDLVRPGQHITLQTLPENTEPATSVQSAHSVTVLTRTPTFAALFKPSAMHSVAGKSAHCLEHCLPALGLDGWRLLNRLDYLTSGLVLAGASLADETTYATWQNQGLVRKAYLALAHGTVQATVLRHLILDEKRRKVRVTDRIDAPLRSTQVLPLFTRNQTTMLLVRIAKGRRHQIRAHLAHAGHPLVGDPLYGTAKNQPLFLHHWRLDMPTFTAAHLPDWPCDLDPHALEQALQNLPDVFFEPDWPES